MILDQYGNNIPAYRPLIQAARPSLGVPSHGQYDRDLDDMIPAHDQRSVMSASRMLYSNSSGIVRGAINQKASYCVNGGYMPKFTGVDTEWGKEAKKFLSKWMKVCNVKGELFNFNKTLELISKSIDRDGDAFILLTESKDGYPMIQLISASRIASRVFGEDTVEYGRYKGLKIHNGVISNKQGRPVAYRVLGKKADGTQDQDISARRLIHVYDVDFVDSTRGLPMFSSAINDIKRMIQVSDNEQHALEILSSLVMSVHNEDGEPDYSNMYSPDTIASPQRPAAQRVQSGTIQYFEAGSGSDIKPLSNDRPSDSYQKFHEKLQRNALVSAGWSHDILCGCSGGSVANRMELAKCKSSISARQATLDPVALRIIVYAISRAIELGKLEANPDFTQWETTKPKSITVDFGRDVKSLVTLYDKGIINLTELVEENGRELEDHLRESYNEEILSIKIKEELEAKHKVKIDPRRVRMLTPNDTPETNQ